MRCQMGVISKMRFESTTWATLLYLACAVAMMSVMPASAAPYSATWTQLATTSTSTECWRTVVGSILFTIRFCSERYCSGAAGRYYFNDLLHLNVALRQWTEIEPFVRPVMAIAPPADVMNMRWNTIRSIIYIGALGGAVMTALP